MKVFSVLDLIGNTPLIKINVNDTILWIKHEGYNLSGSLKDRACISNIMNASPKITEDMILLDASSGNMACSMAMIGKILNMKVEVVCGSKLTQDKYEFIKKYDAKITIHGKYTFEARSYCLEKTKDDKYYFLDQLHNPNNPLGSYNTAKEIFNDIDPDLIVGSLGSGGTMNGVHKFINHNDKKTELLCVEASSGTTIPGVGSFMDGDYVTPFIDELFNESTINRIHVNLKHSIEYKNKLHDIGIYCGTQGGSILYGALSFLHNSKRKYDNVVLIISEIGWKDINKMVI